MSGTCFFGTISQRIRSLDPNDPDVVSKLIEVVDELRDELDEHRDKTEGLSAEKMYLKSKDFKDNNPEIWARICLDARLAATSKKRFSIKQEIENLREIKWYDVRESEEYTFNNSYSSTLLRFLALEVPEVKPFVSHRHCKTDKYFPEEIFG